VHELFGFDVILDENFKPWIIEVNISPSLHSSSPLDVGVKGQMISDLFNIAGYMLPNPKDVAQANGQKHYKKVPKLLVNNKAALPQQLSNDEKLKHQYFIQKCHDEKICQTITDVLTPDDLRILIETEDENVRRGNFIRVFPSVNSKKYLKFFETSRYYNLLLSEWILKYRNSHDKAISILNYHCKKKIHLENPTESSENQWSHSRSSNKFGENTCQEL
jgi:tubulin polyglutamylase TTLL4